MANSPAQELKSALAAADFAVAQRVLPAYSDEVVKLLSAPALPAERQQAIASFRDMLSLARVMRAHLSAQLAATQRQACYRYELPAPEPHAWRFEA